MVAPTCGEAITPKRYPPEFRRRVLDLLDSGKRVTQVARDLGVSDQTVCNWRRQESIDRGQAVGTTTAENIELKRARKRIQQLERNLPPHGVPTSC